MRQHVVGVAALFLIAGAVQAQNARDTAVHKDKEKLANDETWVYDNLESALVVARRTQRPLMIVFR